MAENVYMKMYRFLWTFAIFRGICVLSQDVNPLSDVVRFDNPFVDICPSQIYCRGKLLDDIQSARLYNDSKIFVDKKLKRSESEILDDYAKLLQASDGKVGNEALLKFIDENFDEDKLIEWTPPDFTEEPPVANNVKDSNYKQFVKDVNQIWKKLARKVSEEVKQTPDRYSSIYLPNGFFVAGGRFNECYYWDTYWIIRGALLCGMKNTVKGVIKNILYLVKNYGYMLNGSRVYYKNRSQPPLLIHMVDAYYTSTNDESFVSDNIQILEKELHFWLQNRTVLVKKGTECVLMAQYNTRTNGPRPESYYEDKTLAEKLPASEDKNIFYSKLKSAAESGWDFSSKHMNNNGENTGTLLDTDPQNFIYVELNSILQRNCAILSKFFDMLGQPDKSAYYSIFAQSFQSGIDNLLWNQQEGIWLDYDLTKETSRDYFYASNLAPLWTGSYLRSKSEYYGDKAVEYLQRNDIIKENLELPYLCIPTSRNNTGQQWDFPNCWPPLQSMIMFGLDDTLSQKAKTVAYNIAKAWVNTNYAGFKKTGHMYEKYSALSLGLSGSGGEYTAQTGFGWSNGVLMEVFDKWGLTLESCDFT